MPLGPFPSGTPEERINLLSGTVLDMFPDEFFRRVLENPSMQCYTVGWFSRVMPTIDLLFAPNSDFREIRRTASDFRSMEFILEFPIAPTASEFDRTAQDERRRRLQAALAKQGVDATAVNTPRRRTLNFFLPYPIAKRSGNPTPHTADSLRR